MRLDTSFLVGVWLEALVYGIYLVAFCVCLRLFRTHAPVVGRALPIWLGTLFVLATAHCALSLSAVLDAFVRFTYPRGPPPYPSATPMAGVLPRPSQGPTPAGGTPSPYGNHDPTSYIANRALPTNLASLGVYTGVVFLSNLMLLYRLLVMYKYKFPWIIGPALLVIGAFVISIIVVSKYAHVDLTLAGSALQAEIENVDPWVPPAYAISFLANLSISALMMVKTSFTSKPPKPFLPAFRQTHRHARSAGDDYLFDIDERTGPIPSAPGPAPAPTPTPRRNMISSRWVIVAGLVESGTLAPVFMLAALILYVVQGGEETLLVPMLAPIAALVPTMQIIQLQLGLDSAARTRPISVVPSETRTVGRSPYLVPAPRYHDSSSEDEGQDVDLDVENKARSTHGHHRRSESNHRGHRRSGSGSGSHSNGSTRRPGSENNARRFSARNMWAWRGHSNSNSQSSNEQPPAPVMVQMRDLTGSGERAAKVADPEDGLWERIKLDESKPHVVEPRAEPEPKPEPPPMNRRSTLRKSGGIVKNMISKPTPIAADFPPTTAAIPSTVLPNFTIDTERGVTANLGRSSSVGHDGAGGGRGGALGLGMGRSGTVSEHKYHYRVRPREKTASPLAAYLSAQALEQSGAGSLSGHSPLTNSVSPPLPPPPPPPPLPPLPPQMNSLSPPGMGYHRPSSLDHQALSSSGHLPSTVPTSPASGFTSLNPHSASRNPFRYDPQPGYSDLQRGEPEPTGAGAGPGGMTGIGLSVAHRSPLTVPYTVDPELVPRLGTMPSAPRLAGLDVFFPPPPVPNRGWVDRSSERDVSPAPGLQQDYARARAEALRQMQRERGVVSDDDESVYSTQILNRR